MAATLPLVLNEEDCERGGKDIDGSGIEDDFAYRNNVINASQAVRMGFIRKVYGLLSIQLLMTVVVAGLCMSTPKIKGFIQENDWLIYIAMISSIILIIALYFKRKESPTNLILLAAFTIVEAYTVGVIVTFFSQALVLQALGITLCVFGGLTVYTFQTKRDFSFLSFGLFVGLCVLIVAGIIQIFVQSTAFELVISIAGAFLFSMFILYDTHVLMRTLSPEEYIIATINLYLDIINLFLYILRILQALNQK